jgi:hypothetical protein
MVSPAPIAVFGASGRTGQALVGTAQGGLVMASDTDWLVVNPARHFSRCFVRAD